MQLAMFNKRIPAALPPVVAGRAGSVVGRTLNATILAGSVERPASTASRRTASLNSEAAGDRNPVDGKWSFRHTYGETESEVVKPQTGFPAMSGFFPGNGQVVDNRGGAFFEEFAYPTPRLLHCGLRPGPAPDAESGLTTKKLR